MTVLIDGTPARQIAERARALGLIRPDRPTLPLPAPRPRITTLKLKLSDTERRAWNAARMRARRARARIGRPDRRRTPLTRLIRLRTALRAVTVEDFPEFERGQVQQALNYLVRTGYLVRVSVGRKGTPSVYRR